MAVGQAGCCQAAMQFEQWPPSAEGRADLLLDAACGTEQQRGPFGIGAALDDGRCDSLAAVGIRVLEIVDEPRPMASST